MNEFSTIFYGQQGHRFNKIKEQFFKLKCCSLLPKDLDKHYQQLCRHFYVLGENDDVNLKQAFLNSVPTELSNQTQLQLNVRGIQLANTPLGDIYKIMLKAFDKMYNEHRCIANIVNNSKKLKQPCAFPVGLQIKCSDKSSCLCNSNKKRKHFRSFPKFQFSKFKHLKDLSRKPLRRKRFSHFKFGRKKQQPGKKSPNCFLCGKPSHFAKQCPTADKKSVKMMQQIVCFSGYNDTDDLCHNGFPLDLDDHKNI